MNSVSKAKFWSAPPEGIFFASVEGNESDVSALAASCSVCLPVRRDLVVLFMDKPANIKEQAAIRWDVYLGKLADAAESGCQLCGFMAVRFFHDKMFTLNFGNTLESPVTGCCASASTGEPTEDVQEAIRHLRRYAGEDNRITLVGQSFEGGQSASRLGKIRLAAAFTNLPGGDARQVLGVRSEIILELYTKDDPGAAIITTRPINVNPGSDKSISWAKSQIADCFANHSDCPALTPNQLPKRVITILDDERACLRLAEGSGYYTALSYCWGGPQTFSTTTESLQKHMAGFKISELPQTLQDAMSLTRRLGVENIWIDSLCIIQDSQSDKDAEIPKMSDYYRNSYVTICAAGRRCSNGFLAVHSECENHPGEGIAKDLLKTSFLASKNGIGTLYFREERCYCLSDEPISKRGWTLQERILSPRSLTYGSRLVWQCKACQKSEGGCEDWTFDLRTSGNRRLQLDFARAADKAVSKGTDVVNETTKSEIADFWYRAVEEYSSRMLGDPADKLSAISAIATDVGKLTGDVYLAGHWKSRLLEELLWNTYPAIRQIRTEVWCAPTWSWASLRNKISFARDLPPHAKPVAEIISCTTTPASAQGLYGRVEEGATLVIKAPLMPFQDAGIDMIEKLLNRENGFPEMRDEDMGLEAHRVMINAMLGFSHLDSSNRKDEWDRPDNAALLALFAYRDEVPEPASQETETDGKAKAESGLMDAFKRRLHLRSSKTPQSQGRNNQESTPAPKDEGYMACLVLTQRSDGKYERIGCLRKFWIMDGFSRLAGIAKVVEVV